MINFHKNLINKKIDKEKNKLVKGYAVLELIFYISLFVIISFVVISAMISMTKSFKETAIEAKLAQSGTIMERISREIRGSNNISSISASDLVLNTKDTNGVNKTVEFLLSGTDIQLLENSVLTGNLNTPTVSVTALSFTQINTTQGKAIKVSLTLKATDDTYARLINFYDTVVLRGSY